MDCGVVSIWQIPSAEHKALHECPWLEVQVKSIVEGPKRRRTRKGAFHYEIGRASGLRCTAACTVGRRWGRVYVRTHELYAPHFYKVFC
jgi:hypothetical protein